MKINFKKNEPKRNNFDIGELLKCFLSFENIRNYFTICGNPQNSYCPNCQQIRKCWACLFISNQYCDKKENMEVILILYSILIGSMKSILSGCPLLFVIVFYLFIYYEHHYQYGKPDLTLFLLNWKLDEVDRLFIISNSIFFFILDYYGKIPLLLKALTFCQIILTIAIKKYIYLATETYLAIIEFLYFSDGIAGFLFTCFYLLVKMYGYNNIILHHISRRN
jgi:hypothetical protein